MTSKNNLIDVNVLTQHNIDMQRYAIYISRDRTLPDYKDGLKPVHRRILYAMCNDCTAAENNVKSAQIVGAVLGKYHPHSPCLLRAGIFRRDNIPGRADR